MKINVSNSCIYDAKLSNDKKFCAIVSGDGYLRVLEWETKK